MPGKKEKIKSLKGQTEKVQSLLGETAKGKGRRFFLALIVFVFLAFGSMPAFASLGEGIADHSTSVVLQQESQVLYVYNVTGSGIPYAQSNTSVAYDMPFNRTMSYVRTYVTVAEMNDFSVNKVVLALAYERNITMELGFGTNSSNFLPEISISSHNVTITNFSVRPQYLTGNQSQSLMLKLVSNDTAYSFSLKLYGNNGLHTIFGPVAAEDVSYVFSGTVVFGLSAVAGIFYDLDFGRKNK